MCRVVGIIFVDQVLNVAGTKSVVRLICPDGCADFDSCESHMIRPAGILVLYTFEQSGNAALCMQQPSLTD